MSFALVPDDGPHRVVRFVDQDKMPDDRTIAILDRNTNVLLIERHLFEQLSPAQQSELVKTQSRVIEI